jgi:hypothetical protein
MPSPALDSFKKDANADWDWLEVIASLETARRQVRKLAGEKISVEYS